MRASQLLQLETKAQTKNRCAQAEEKLNMIIWNDNSPLQRFSLYVQLSAKPFVYLMKAAAYDSHYFSIHKTTQWPLVTYAWGTVILDETTQLFQSHPHFFILPFVTHLCI